MENNDAQHLQKLRAYWDAHQAFPSMAKLRDVVAMGSTASVHEMIGRLVEAGLLQRVEGRVAPTKAFLAQPLEYPKSSQPDQLTASERPASLNLLDYVMPRPDRTFLVPVPDEQMAANGLRQGDMLVMQQDVPAQPGDIVAMRQDGRLYLRLLTSLSGQKLVLKPAFDVVLSDPGLSEGTKRSDIAGVAIAMVRRFDLKQLTPVKG